MLRRLLKYEEVYLKLYDFVREATISIGNYFSFYSHIRAYQALKYQMPREVYYSGLNWQLARIFPDEVKDTRYQQLLSA